MNITRQSVVGVERTMNRATVSARDFASPDALIDILQGLHIIQEVRFFVVGMADATTDDERQGYRARLLRCLGDKVPA